MIETMLGVAMAAVAFMAVAYVRIRGGCGADCGSCERACAVPDSNPLPEPNDGRDEKG